MRAHARGHVLQTAFNDAFDGIGSGHVPCKLDQYPGRVFVAIMYTLAQKLYRTTFRYSLTI